MHTCIQANKHTCIHAHMHTCIHTYIHIHAYMHTCMHTCTHAYINTDSQLNILTHIQTYKHTHIHTYTSMSESKKLLNVKGGSGWDLLRLPTHPKDDLHHENLTYYLLPTTYYLLSLLPIINNVYYPVICLK